MSSAGVAGSADETAEAILVAHQRATSRNCLCGWNELGRSHARHQVAMLREARLLVDTEPVRATF